MHLENTRTKAHTNRWRQVVVGFNHVVNPYSLLLLARHCCSGNAQTLGDDGAAVDQSRISSRYDVLKHEQRTTLVVEMLMSLNPLFVAPHTCRESCCRPMCAVRATLRPRTYRMICPGRALCRALSKFDALSPDDTFNGVGSLILILCTPAYTRRQIRHTCSR